MILLEIYSGFNVEIRRQAEQTPEPVVDGRIPFCERPTCSINDACRAVGFGRTKLYDLIDEGLVDTVKIGRRRFVRVPSLLAYLGRCR
jgi:Helix-turn-helix domain